MTMDYTFSDFNDGDEVQVRAGKHKGKVARIVLVTAQCYFMRLESGQYCSVRHGSLLQRYDKRE